MQTPKLDEFTLERQVTREKSQNREMDGLDSKYLGRQALKEPSQDRYDDQRSGKCDYGERLKNSKFTGYFQGQANIDTGKAAGYYYNTLIRVTFKQPSSNQAPDDEASLLNQII